MATSATPGRLFTVAMSPMANTSGCPGQGEVGQHGDAAGAVELGPARFGQLGGQWGRLHARRPDRRVGLDPGVAAVGLVLRIFGRIDQSLQLADTALGPSLTEVGPGAVLVAAGGRDGRDAGLRDGRGRGGGRRRLGDDDPGGRLCGVRARSRQRRESAGGALEVPGDERRVHRRRQHVDAPRPAPLAGSGRDQVPPPRGIHNHRTSLQSVMSLVIAILIVVGSTAVADRGDAARCAATRPTAATSTTATAPPACSACWRPGSPSCSGSSSSSPSPATTRPAPAPRRRR